ncbi:hypothetical protein P3S68_016395 [Capsicum galapagoense]
MNISVLLRHFGVWINDIKYEGYKSDGIVVSEQKIEARYIVDGNAAPLLIRNEMGVKLYIEIMKSEPDFGMYPFIITTVDKSDSEMLFDGKAGSVMCLDNLCEDVVELISYNSNCSALLPLFDIKGNKIITDCKNSEVKVGQIYKDKCTLISVMVWYIIEHSFNF